MRIFRQCTLAAAALGGLFLTVQCKPKEQNVAAADNERYFKTPATAVARARSNQTAGEPTALLRSRADDPINWQPWTPDLLEMAEKEQKPVLTVIINGKAPGTYTFLEHFSSLEGGLAKRLNEAYICCLADLEANPELALLAFHLCSETRQTYSFPLLLWLSHEGNPVAWLPLVPRDLDDLERSVTASHDVVRYMWQEKQRYFVENSKNDNRRRQERLAPAEPGDVPGTEEARALFSETTSRLTALYDPATRTLDLGGGVVPADLLLMTLDAASSPVVPDYLRDRAKRMAVEVHDVLARAPILDPLDGGLFISRRSTDWSIPSFCKPASTQASAARSFAGAGELAGQSRFPEIAKELLAFQARGLGRDGEGIGSFRTLSAPDQESEIYFWTYEELEELLTPEQLKVAALAYNLAPRGNIPRDQDPTAAFYRRNILSQHRTASEVASALGQEESAIRETLSLARETLRARRVVKKSEGDNIFFEDTRIAEYNAQRAQALLKVGNICGDAQLVTEGRAMLGYLRDNFYTPKEGLWRIPPQEDQRGVRARGRDYAAVLAAVLESHASGLDTADLDWAEALARETLRALGTEDLLIDEAPRDDLVVNVGYFDSAMILGTSTWGSLYGSLERLRRVSTDERFGIAADAIASRVAGRLEMAALVHTDFLEGLLVRAHDRVAVLHGDDDALRSSLHQVLREPAARATVTVSAEALSQGDRHSLPLSEGSGVTLFRDLGAIGTFSDPDQLRAFLARDLSGE